MSLTSSSQGLDRLNVSVDDLSTLILPTTCDQVQLTTLSARIMGIWIHQAPVDENHKLLCSICAFVNVFWVRLYKDSLLGSVPFVLPGLVLRAR